MPTTVTAHEWLLPPATWAIPSATVSRFRIGAGVRAGVGACGPAAMVAVAVATVGLPVGGTSGRTVDDVGAAVGAVVVGMSRAGVGAVDGAVLGVAPTTATAGVVAGVEGAVGGAGTAVPPGGVVADVVSVGNEVGVGIASACRSGATQASAKATVTATAIPVRTAAHRETCMHLMVRACRGWWSGRTGSLAAVRRELTPSAVPPATAAHARRAHQRTLAPTVHRRLP